MSPPNRLALGGALVALGELALGALAFASFGPERIVLFLVACAAATAAVTVALRVLLARMPPGGGERGDKGDGPPPPPPWWPEFERRFREHARARERTPA